MKALLSSIKIPLLFTFIIGVLFLAINYFFGTEQSFLFLNTDLGTAADFLFQYITYLGDGIIWVPILVLTFMYKKKYLLFVIAAIFFSTILTHLFKDWVFPLEPRPTKAIQHLQLIHVVKDVTLHTIASFPSGHTTTAFSVYLIICFFKKNKWVVISGFIVALLVAYSRIYLAQHFLRDVGGGMIAATITILLSFIVQNELNTVKIRPFTP
jgi:membrane-associated phospholipid phosphatase